MIEATRAQKERWFEQRSRMSRATELFAELNCQNGPNVRRLAPPTYFAGSTLSGVVHSPAVGVTSEPLSAVAGRAVVPRANQTGVMETSRGPELTGSKRTSSSPEY